MHWVAHVFNRGSEAAAAVPYVWTIDGEPIRRGVTDLAPGRTELLLPWSWTSARHQIAFAIVPPAELEDATRDDDQVTMASHGLSLWLWAQQGLYDWLLEEGRPGFERLMQHEVERWNAILARAAHSSTPNGVLDRVRLDRVTTYPDEQRFLSNRDLLEPDLYWVFSTAATDSRFLHKGASSQALGDQTIVLHEVLHMRGLVDLYAYDVIHRLDRPDARINIEEQGRPVVGTFLMPSLTSGGFGMMVYRSPFNGLMGTHYRATANLTEHSAWGLNLWAGRRTPKSLDRWGNLINHLSSVVQPASYVALIPARTELSFVDQNGSRIETAQVDVFLDHQADTYVRNYRATPDRTLATDARGLAVLPGDALDTIAPRALGPPKAQVIILGVRTPSARGFTFLPVHTLNMLYFRGARERGELQLRVTLHRW